MKAGSEMVMAKYSEDDPLLENAKFMQWVSRLEDVMCEFAGSPEGDGKPPYSLPLYDGTGLKCWHEMFTEGYTPQDAFDSDRINW